MYACSVKLAHLFACVMERLPGAELVAEIVTGFVAHIEVASELAIAGIVTVPHPVIVSDQVIVTDLVTVPDLVMVPDLAIVPKLVFVNAFEPEFAAS